MKKTLRFLYLTIFTVSLSYSQVVINEIMYNPYYEVNGASDTDDSGEWIEFFNAGQESVDMSGWKIVEGITFTFPSGAAIAPGAYVILARDSVRFKADNGFDPHFDWGGSDNGALSNSGEDITLVNSSSVTVDSVDYDDGSGSGNGWGTSSSGHDGTGPSLELKDFSKNNVGGDNSDGFWGISSGKGSPNKINTNFNGTVWKSTLASDDKPIRTIPAGTWTQDATPVINSLADFPKDTTYWQYWANTGGAEAANETEGGHFEHQGSSGKDSSYANVSYSNGYMRVDYSTHDTEGWGGYVKLQHMHPDTLNGIYDWSQFDSLSYQYYVDSAGVATQSSSITIRFNLIEYSTIDGAHDYTGSQALGEYYYSFAPGITDSATGGWKTVTIPLVNNPGEFGAPTAFNRTGWAGIPGNERLDTDKIKGWSIEFSMGGGGDGDRTRGTILFDNIMLKGQKKIPLVLFNGKALGPKNSAGSFTWGGSASELVTGAGVTSATNALKWTLGDYNWGVTGYGFNLSPNANMTFEWPTDTLQFKYKTAKYSGTNARFQFEAGSGKLVHEFSITADGAWQTVKLPLKDFVYGDNTTSGFDTSNVKVAQFIAQGTGFNGEVIHLTDVWTGSPVFDFVPPAKPQSVTAIPGQYLNAVVWDDVPGEAGETYDVYASEVAFTDTVSDSLATNKHVDLVQLGVQEGKKTANHDILVPLSNIYNRSYYYAVVAKDENGNKSTVSASTSPVSNFGRGVPIVSPTAPTDFKADGDLSEWSSVVPFVVGTTENSYGTPNVTTAGGGAGTFDDANDTGGKFYIAMDDSMLYMAADIIDNVVVSDTANTGGGWWTGDALQMCLGLYDARGPKHNSLKRGAKPDYKLYFTQSAAASDNGGGELAKNGDGHYFHSNNGTTQTANYTVEFRISLDSLRLKVSGWDASAGTNSTPDSLYVPKVGDRLPVELLIHDNDSGSGLDAITTLSKLDNDRAHQTTEVWTYTFLGNKDGNKLSTEQDIVADVFSLEKNYPNPFNPTTTIEYSIGIAGPAKLMIYDILGREVVSLVNEYKQVGRHKVMWNASTMSSGVYFYRLETPTFTKTQKMILMK
tara:strand:- start:77 stop:3328 length:3252 start_codon:yes stop_codon:yes gene_type:complete